MAKNKRCMPAGQRLGCEDFVCWQSPSHTPCKLLWLTIHLLVNKLGHTVHH